MRYFYLLFLTVIVASCGASKKNSNNLKKSNDHVLENKIIKNINYFNSKNFLFEDLKYTSDLQEYTVGSGDLGDLSPEEVQKCIKTEDAAHYYKLVAVYKEGKTFSSLIVLYVMEGGSKQYLITVDDSGNCKDDLVVHSNHREGPQKLEEGKILLFRKIHSEFKEDKIFVSEELDYTESYAKNSNRWQEVYLSTYQIDERGSIEFIEKRQLK